MSPLIQRQSAHAELGKADGAGVLPNRQRLQYALPQPCIDQARNALPLYQQPCGKLRTAPRLQSIQQISQFLRIQTAVLQLIDIDLSPLGKVAPYGIARKGVR